ncbi:helix-turn-helix domain-containing protein [Nonomuraea wenchangensis]|uniref:helix-turn-helix domain-containing protein n=1 Tax=Nonomuraea wenchangensis TaxID=568860 RepID=UPI0033F2745F
MIHPNNPEQAAAHARHLLRRLRVRYIGTPGTYETLLEITAIFAALHPASANGSELDIEQAAARPWYLTVQDAADITGLTTRAIRLACKHKRLNATKQAGVWLIAPDDLAHWRTKAA